MSVDDLVTSQPEPEPVARGGAPQVPALVVVWCPSEPWRLGEVLLLPQRGEEYVFGRGTEGDGRVFLHRQRPGECERMPPVAASAISREAIRFNELAIGLMVRPCGKPILLNGAEISGDHDLVREAGTTIEVKQQIMFLYTRRPMQMPPLRYAKATAPFGARDQHGMIGESPVMWKLRDDLAFVARSPGHVLLRGASGTGKEAAAGAIHRDTPRSGPGMLISENAASISPGLIDAELFGSARNFPGAGMPERPGLVGRANGGTLFLDEIGESSLEFQAALLRALDGKGEYRRVGESDARHSDFRLVAATNRPQSALKHDFLSRLTHRIELPSFTERREDAALIAREHVRQLAEGAGPASAFVREIEDRLEPNISARLADALVRQPFTTNARDIDTMLAASIRESTPPWLTPLEQRPPTDNQGAEPARPPEPRGARWFDAERVRAALAASNGNRSAAARQLGVDRTALYRMMTRFGIT